MLEYNYSEKEKKEILKSMKIIVDTREKNNYHILEYWDNSKIEYIKKSLEFGDYSFFIPANIDLGIMKDIHFDKEIVIERKNSLDELCGNLGKNRQQFENELLRATKGRKFILMVEDATFQNLLRGNYRSLLSSKALFSSLMTFQNRYNVIITFMEKDCVYQYIYNTFYYYLRELLK